MVRKIIRTVLILFVILLLAAAGYVLYVFLGFHRIEDNQTPAVEGNAEKEEVSPGQELTVLSYNIGFGAYSDDYTFFMDGGKESRAFSKDAVYQNINGAMEAVIQAEPDVVLMQEVDIDGTRSYHVDERTIVLPAMEQAGSFQHIFAQNYDSPYLLYPVMQPHGANQAGIMTLSKYRMTDALRKSLPIEEGITKVIDLDRCYSKVRIPVENGKELIVYNLHLSAYTAKAETAENQLKMVVQDMQEEYDAGNYCIAGGDFNRDLLGNSPEIFHTPVLADNWAKPVNMDLFTEDIALAAPYDTDAPAASCRNPDKPYEPGDFVVTVDGFIRSANVNVTQCRVIDTGFRYSDHNPVVMKVQLDE